MRDIASPTCLVAGDGSERLIALARCRKSHLHREHVLGPEPRINLAQLHHRPHEQPGAGQQHDRHCDLHDHEEALHTLPTEAGSRASRSGREPRRNAPSGGSGASIDSSTAMPIAMTSVKPKTDESIAISFARGE
jgi:hypothetical protein